ncbi:hypothetical protein [Lacrimispora algidixylanolytica]|uniref:Lipoprotein n=1 Tax=Lacrimispora algidixylanolytica TaxID=94868 RepID=A0A419TC26_9FIRM|nr:hypothetical protein [Lacrimispora algidixylanolytica]RKD35028.1 hypothetical protein BET01_01365 [Lacrimispora algidixylanolytica]
MKAFKKYVIMTTLIAFSAMALYGCGKNQVKLPEPTTTIAPTDPSSNTVEQTKDSTVDHTENVTKEGSADNEGNDSLKQLAFLNQEKTITLSDVVDDEKMESLLGKADEIKSHTYSPDDGKNMDQLNGKTEKEYHYQGLVIKTMDGAENKKSYIFNIEIIDPKYPTVRNIKVGDSYELLKDTYPEGNLLGGEISNEEDDYRYEPANYVDVMNFHIKDKKVESIQIYSLID